MARVTFAMVIKIADGLYKIYNNRAMKNLKQHLIDEEANVITAREKEVQESDEELRILEAKLKVEKKAMDMKDVNNLREDFKYSIQGLENMLVVEQNRNAELKKELEMARYRKAVIEKFSESELN